MLSSSMFSTGWTSGISSTCRTRDFSSICKSSGILSPVFTGVHVARSLVFYVLFYRSLFVLLSFFRCGYCIVCPSIYGF